MPEQGTPSIHRLKVRFIGRTPPPVGGVTIHTLRLFQWMERDKTVDARLTSLNFNLEHQGKIENIRFLPHWMLLRCFVGFDEDIVHYQGSNLGGLLFFAFLKRLRPGSFRLVWSVHGELIVPGIDALNPMAKKIVKQAFKETDFVFCANHSIAKQLVPYGLKTAVIPPFLPPVNLSAAGKADYGFIPAFKGEDTLLVAGAYRVSFNPEGRDIYGLDCLFDAFEKLQGKRFKLLILIPGYDADGKAYLERLLSCLSAEQRTRILIVSRPDVEGWAVIGRADIFLRPTITDGDSLSIREALLQGIPVIASDCSPRPEGVIKFATSDSADFAEKILATKTSRQLLQAHRMPVDTKGEARKFSEAYRKVHSN